MAERISSLSPPGGGRPPLYPWTEWTDGSAWRITRGEDFTVPVESMAANIYSHAWRRGMSVTVRQDLESIEFQFAVEQAA